MKKRTVRNRNTRGQKRGNAAYIQKQSVRDTRGNAYRNFMICN